MIGVFLLLQANTAHAQESLQVDMTIESATVNPRTGEVIFSGTVTCSEPATAFVNISVNQPVGRLTSIQGFANTSLPCDEDGETYTTSAFASSGSFKPGNAVLQGILTACDPFGCSQVITPPQAIRLMPQK
jgi:hypothetical protein